VWYRTARLYLGSRTLSGSQAPVKGGRTARPPPAAPVNTEHGHERWITAAGRACSDVRGRAFAAGMFRSCAGVALVYANFHAQMRAQFPRMPDLAQRSRRARLRMSLTTATIA